MNLKEMFINIHYIAVSLINHMHKFIEWNYFPGSRSITVKLYHKRMFYLLYYKFNLLKSPKILNTNAFNINVVRISF